MQYARDVIESLIAHWGYCAVGVGSFLEGEAVVLTAGALAHEGLLSLPLVIVAAFAGSLAWGQLWFQVGRRLGRAAIARRPKWQARASDVERWVTRYGDLFVLGFRFMAGMGTAAPVVLGASGLPPWRFTRADVAGAAIWATAFGTAGWGIGAWVARLLGKVPSWEIVVVAALVAAVLFAAAVRWVGTRRHQVTR